MSNIYRKKILSILLASVFALNFSNNANAQSQPIVVLEYPNSSTNQQNYSDNLFIQNYDYTTTHKVRANETLSHILEDYYSGSGLNMKFVEMAIIFHNKHAFVNSNPNFLFAEKTLKLPSLNQIQALLLGNNAPESLTNSKSGSIRSQEIYFIGG